MSQTSLVDALALLLSNPQLRDEFELSASDLADRLNINKQERSLFCALSRTQLEIQAGLLIRKRLREVSRYLPLTFQSLGHSLNEIFTHYAIEYWPNSYQRHIQDAWKFCQYLKSQGYNCNSSEWNRLSFRQHNNRLSLNIVRDPGIFKRRTFAIQLIYQFRNNIREKHFYFGV